MPRRRVLVAVGHDPLFVAGPGSHLNELVTIAGGENVAHDGPPPYPMFALDVLMRAPEVIVDSADTGRNRPRGMAAGFWGEWPFRPRSPSAASP